ncbi:MAG: hypothetical protein RL026_618 [Pseudomonadota bacterium]|jgi:energy-coupling factor transporter ATP-binding protein EcfA2
MTRPLLLGKMQPGTQGTIAMPDVKASLRRVGGTLTKLLGSLPQISRSRDAAGVAARSLPVIWLLGKTGAGKTSLVATLTGCSDAEIGTGWRPCTKTMRQFDYPADTPGCRFLDTRGLGEAGYDAGQDLKVCEREAHQIMLVVKAADHALHDLLRAVNQIRRAHRDWPAIVVQTSLHELYPSRDSLHPEPYPFDGAENDFSSPAVPPQLRDSLARQRKAILKDWPGARPRFVAVDFTRPEEGFIPADYGREALVHALDENLSHRAGLPWWRFPEHLRRRVMRR